MKNKRWDVLIYCLVFTTIGAMAGWIASRQSTGAGSIDPHHTDSGQDADPRVDLSPQTLNNLGVTVGELQPTSFVRYRSVPAVVAHTPFNEQPVVAPIGGRVREILVEPGMLVRAGDPVLRLVRDPIPRPTLHLTEEILKPAREAVHQMVVELHKASEEKRIVQTELTRIEKYTEKVGEEDLPILPRQTVIDLRYQRLRAEYALKRARLELKKHGFTAEQIDSIAEGSPIPQLGEDTWKRALERNGLWPDAARKLLAVVPESLHGERWTIATIGELAASGLIRDSLISWLEEAPEGCDHFLEIGALLQKGYSVEAVRELHALHALDPVVELRAPGHGRIEDWDVVQIDVKAGEQITTGHHLMRLLDPRVLYLKTRPLGGEQADVLHAMNTRGVCEARPLIDGSGPVLSNVDIEFLSSDASTHGTIAYAKLRNEPIESGPREDGRTLRSWKLRAGLKYTLRVPVDSLDNVYVLPAKAVTYDGPDRVVFLQDGDTFKSVDVTVTYENEEVAVIAIDAHTRLFPGDVVVLSGAYALSMALKNPGDQVDAHAGHSH
jgi:multidrug efflux pump subunit AcrA (membrane-fusion protein)